MASYQHEMRTKLSSQATPFRPNVGGRVSTSSSLTDSLAPCSASSHPDLSDLDSSTRSAGTSRLPPTANLTPPTPPGQFVYPPPAHIGHHSGTSTAAAWGSAPGSQGVATSNPFASPTDFKLGDFRSKLLQRAQMLQKQTDQAFEQLQKYDSSPKNSEICLVQALMSDGLSMPRNTVQTGEGQSSEVILDDRRQAMNICMQHSVVPDTVESTTTNDEIRPPLMHAATFNEGMASKKAEASSTDPMKEALPIRNTFIHFPEANGPVTSAFQWSTAPAVLSTKEFHTKYPGMEAAHIRGDCQPCVYFTKKQDGCRWGADCEFCHLCPVGSWQKKRKEKSKALKEKEYQERRALLARQAD